jgi:hypothetical protein
MSLVFLQPGVNRTARLPDIDLAAFTADAVYSWCPQFQVIIDRAEETGYFPGRQAYRLDVVSSQQPANAVEHRPHIGQESDFPSV